MLIVNGAFATINKTVNVGETISIELSYVTSKMEYSPNDVIHVTKGTGSTYEEAYIKKITGLKPGVATIYFYQGSSLKDTYVITVVEVKQITLPPSVVLHIGDSYTFLPVITDAGATTTFSWLSSNPSVATIDANGTLTTKGIGVTTITCIAANGISAQCEVTVNPIIVANITLDEASVELAVGDNLLMKVSVLPENATNKNLTWSSTNENVAIVNESGLVTAVGSGSCQIKAVAEDGSGKSASCVVTVSKNNKLSISDMAQCNGGRGVMNVALTDEETILGFQFDLQLPNGVTVATDESNALMASLTGNASSTHNLASSKVADGLYRFVVTPKGTTPLSSATNDGMSITIDVADDVAVGAYTMTVKDVEMTVLRGSDYVDVHPKDNTATLTISEAVAGDVNGDTRISVTDVISIVAYIMENTPSKFIMKAADVNDDGNITITDAVLVIDIILNDKNQAPRKITPIVEPQ